VRLHAGAKGDVAAQRDGVTVLLQAREQRAQFAGVEPVVVGVRGAGAAVETERAVRVDEPPVADVEPQFDAPHRLGRVAGEAGDRAQVARGIGQPLLVGRRGVTVAAGAGVARAACTDAGVTSCGRWQSPQAGDAVFPSRSRIAWTLPS